MAEIKCFVSSSKVIVWLFPCSKSWQQIETSLKKLFPPVKKGENAQYCEDLSSAPEQCGSRRSKLPFS